MTRILAALIISLGMTGNAANWYVRTNSVGSKTGADWSNAWAFTNITWASVTAGDTIWCAGGPYSAGWIIGKSGTSGGGRITIKRVTASDSTPVAAAGWNSAFDSQCVMPADLNLANFSYLTLDGQVTEGIRINMASGGQGITYGTTGNMSDITLRYVYVQGPGFGPFQGYGVRASIPATSFTISNNLMSHCRVDGTIEGIDIQGWLNGVIEYSKLYNFGNEVNQHSDVLYFWGGNSNVIFRFNTVSNSAAEAVVMQFGFHGLWFYGNTWDVGSQGDGDCFQVGDGAAGFAQSDIHFINETYKGWTGSAIRFDSSTITGSNEVHNCIFYNCVNSPNCPSDYNAYIGNNGGFGFAGETHSIAILTNAFVDPTHSDFHLVTTIASNYPRNKGVASYADGFVNFDMDGTQRGADGTWDIGAFEFSSADTTPPTLSSATIPSAGNVINFVFSEAVSIGAGGNAGWAFSMSGGAVTATYSSGSGSSTLVYTLSRTVLSGETKSSGLDYTQPGNGIEDASGNDLVTLTGASVTNNSTASGGGGATGPSVSLGKATLGKFTTQ